LTLLSLVPIERGRLMDGWISLLESAVGWGVWLMPIGLAAVGLWLIFKGLDREITVDAERPLGAVLIFFLGLALVHLIAGGEDPQALAEAGEGGGYVGYGLGQLLVSAVGTPGAVLVLVTLCIIGLIMLFGLSLGDIWLVLRDSVQEVWRPDRRPEIRIRGRKPAKPSNDRKPAGEQKSADEPQL
jgi:S-DNA-T family DNA segregation ATPase FtsK/SpoIIIE